MPYFDAIFLAFSAEDLTEKKHKTYRFPMIAGTWAGGGEMQLLGKFYVCFRNL